ncbi:MAG TPA: EAL domain-containing protein [Burkholderiaceae bacterium]
MIREDDKSFIALFEAHPCPMWVYDLETLRFLAVNGAAIIHYGYSEAEFLGMTIRDIRPEEDWPELERNLTQSPTARLEKSGIWRHRRKDGTLIDVDITSHPVSFNNRACKFVLAHDVTDRVEAQRKIERLNRIYAVLSGINSAIVRITERQTLLDETCRIAVIEGNFVGAAIALTDRGGDVPQILAQAGNLPPGTGRLVHHGYAELAATGAGAMPENRPVICNDLLRDSRFSGPLDPSDVGEVRALAALPLTVDEHVVGALVLFTGTVGLFDEPECRLLRELAADVSFSLQYIAREEERRRIVERLRESEAGLRQAQISNRSGHVVTGPDGSFESWSDTLPSLIGLARTDMPPTTRRWLDIVHPGDRERFRAACIEAARSGTRAEIEYRIQRPDGSVVHLHQLQEPLQGFATPDRGTRWFNTIQDVTEQKRQQGTIERLSRIYAVLSGVNSAIVRIRQRDDLFREICRVAVREGRFALAWIDVIDSDAKSGGVIAQSGDTVPYMERIRAGTQTGDGANDPDNSSNWPGSIAAREMRTVVCNDTLAAPNLAHLHKDLEAAGHRSIAALPLIAENRSVAVLNLCSGEAQFFDDDQARLLNDLAGDLSFALQFLNQEKQLSFLAYHDPLTGLPNTTLFLDRLTQLIHQGRRDQEDVCVVLFNLDRFASLNDAMGRRAGDALLKQVARRLEETLRDTDSVARIVADTFAVALGGVRPGEDMIAILQQRILAVFSHPYELDGQEIRMTARAGLAVRENDDDDADRLFKYAEIALRNAKSSGERHLFYARHMNAARATRLALEIELQTALEAGQFEVHYQPRIDLRSGKIISAEALIRWRHPERGMIPPSEFIPIAEETGLIVSIGAWIIDAVCAQQAAWMKQQIELVPVAVNISAIQWKKGEVLETIRASTAKHGVDEQHLEFELTETAVMANPDEAAEYLHALRKMGMRLSLDDFGTGYSSLAYLKRFPFNFVKIDRAFVSEVTRNPGDAAIAAAIIAMAHSLNLRVVAEGVETEGQLLFLRQRGCDEMQGFLFSRPVPAEQFAIMLQEDRRLPFETAAGGLSNGARTLLIVDDEPNNLAALCRLLRRDSYRILQANSAEEGLDLLSTNPVQVIISDHRMPGMSGTEFLDVVRELYPETMRIILSGYADLQVVIDSVNRGAVFKFLTKPWDDELLREHIRDAFRRHNPK